MDRHWMAALAVVVAALSPPASADNAVTTWDRLAQEAIQADGRPPASSEYLHALVHLAVWDAVTSISSAEDPFLRTVPVKRPVSLEAAVATAAHRVVATRLPAQAASLTASRDGFLAGIPDGPAKVNGIAVGMAAADQLLAARSGDQFDTARPYEQRPPGPGVFEPVTAKPPVDGKLAQVPPLLPHPPDRFRPPGPEPLASAGYARDFRETKDLGRADSRVRTTEQTETARFWSEHTFGQYARSLRELATARGLDLTATSRFLTRVHLASAEAVLAGFEAKYHHRFWRPVHAVRRAESDGNAATEPDATWESLLVVNHPEYPAAHAFWTSAMTRAVARALGTERLSWPISSTVTGTTRTIVSLEAMRTEVFNSRVWGGLHFRHSLADGDRLGREVEEFASGFLRGQPASATRK